MERDDQAARQVRSDRAIQRALGRLTPVRRRPDGKPEVDGAECVSAAHTGDITLAVAGPTPIGCDIEPVVARPESVWRDLLGRRFALAERIAGTAGEDVAAAATRVWAASECLVKTGLAVDTPLVLAGTHSEGWILLEAGAYSIATLVTTAGDADRSLGLAVLICSERNF
jgi:enediyne polyketide synthase